MWETLIFSSSQHLTQNSKQFDERLHTLNPFQMVVYLTVSLRETAWKDLQRELKRTPEK